MEMWKLYWNLEEEGWQEQELKFDQYDHMPDFRVEMVKED